MYGRYPPHTVHGSICMLAAAARCPPPCAGDVLKAVKHLCAMLSARLHMPCCKKVPLTQLMLELYWQNYRLACSAVVFRFSAEDCASFARSLESTGAHSGAAPCMQRARGLFTK